MKEILSYNNALMVSYMCLGLLCMPVYSCRPVELRDQLIKGLENQMVDSGAWLSINQLPESEILNLRDILAKFGKPGLDPRPNKFSKDTFG